MAPLRYHSTRGNSPTLGFGDVLLTGLAPDGGLYVPVEWPARVTGDIDTPYTEFAAEIMWPFVDGAIDRQEFERICHASYSGFDHDDVVPITELADGLELIELFHGPTLAFKDIAMQLLGRLFDHELGRRGSRVTIVGATSGDTGSAAIEAFRDRANVDIVILHPHGRTSEVQRRQMTTVDAANVHNVAIEGTFDDCQDMVKAMFADERFRRDVDLAAVNSINWARVMAQVVYYVWAARRSSSRPEPVSVTVPTGNFGNVFAGRVAQRLGAPIHDFVVASNRNDILTQFFGSGTMTISDVEPSLSPSMDIQVSSNLERLLFELFDRNGEVVAEELRRFRRTGRLELPDRVRSVLGETWSGESLDDDETLEVMRREHETSGVVLDPHTAVGVGAARRNRGAHPSMVMATAHPAKFPDAVEAATGLRPALPERLGDLLDRPEHFTILPPDLQVVQEFTRSSCAADRRG